jgi:photosystem II stability/assembly factor-like uncharacterized protein
MKRITIIFAMTFALSAFGANIWETKDTYQLPPQFTNFFPNHICKDINGRPLQVYDLGPGRAWSVRAALDDGSWKEVDYLEGAAPYGCGVSTKNAIFTVGSTIKSNDEVGLLTRPIIRRSQDDMKTWNTVLLGEETSGWNIYSKIETFGESVIATGYRNVGVGQSICQVAISKDSGDSWIQVDLTEVLATCFVRSFTEIDQNKALLIMTQVSFNNQKKMVSIQTEDGGLTWNPVQLDIPIEDAGLVSIKLSANKDKLIGLMQESLDLVDAKITMFSLDLNLKAMSSILVPKPLQGGVDMGRFIDTNQGLYLARTISDSGVNRAIVLKTTDLGQSWTTLEEFTGQTGMRAFGIVEDSEGSIYYSVRGKIDDKGVVLIRKLVQE